MKPKSSLAAATVAILALAVIPTQATILYWDGTTSTVNADGGNGTWDTTATNWDNALFGGTNSTWNNATPDFAVFGGSAGTVTLGTPITTAGFQFNTTGYVLDASTNALSFGATNNSILFNKVAAATITGAIGGTGNVSIGSANPTSGASFTSHTLNLNGTSAGGWSGTTTVNQFTTLALSGLNQGLASTTGGITLNGGGITLTNAAAQATLDRVNASAITSNGGTITYANTATASTAYAETIGSVALTSGQLNLVLSTNQNAASNSQTLTLGGLTQAGTSAVTFSAATTAPNATTNIIAVTGAAAGFIGPWATTGTTAALQTDYAVYNASSQVVPAAIAATAENSGSWIAGANVTLSGATTLTATRTVNTLRYTGGALALGLGAATFNLQTYGVLNGGSGLLTISTTGTGALTTPSGGGNLYLTSGNNAITVSAPINNNGSAVTVVKSGSGTLTLSSTTSNFSGGIVLNAGTLVTTANTNLGSGGGITVNGNATWSASTVTYARNVTLNSGAILSFDGGNPIITGNVTGTGGVANANGFGNQVNFSGTANTFQGPVFIGSTGTGGQAYRMQFASFADSSTANGRIVFRASSVSHSEGSVFQYDGGTNLTIANRQFEIASTGATPTNGHQIRSSGAGTLSISTELIVSSTTAQTLVLGGTNTGANNFTTNINNGASSALSLTKANNGNWNLSGTNTYTGTTVMGFNNPAGGNLTFQGIQALSPSTTLSQTHAGGTGGHGTFKILDDAASPASRSAVNVAMTSSNTSHGMTLFVGNNNTANGGTSSGTTTGSTIALGNLNFTQSVVGNTSQQLNVTGANSYRLQVSNVNMPSTSGNWNGILNPTTAPLTVSGNVQQVAGSTAGTMTLTLGGTAAGNIVSGEIRNSLDGSPRALTVLKNSAATWTLSNNNTFSGGITFSAGVLNINHAGALGSGTVTIGAGTFNNTTASTIINANNNAIAWNGDATFSGTRSLDLGTGNAILGGNRSIVVSANTLTIGGVVSDGASDFNITLGGNGRLILSNAASTYSGKTVVGNNAGSSLTLQVSKLDNLSANSSLGAPTTAALGLIQLGSVSNSSTLDYIGTSASSTDRQVQIGSASNGSGNAIINNNSVDPTHTLTFSNAAFNVAAGGANSSNRTIRLGGSNTGDNTVSGAIVNNTGSTVLVGVAKLGTGTWVLSGNSSYTSGTTVENGILKVNTIKNSGVNSAVGAGTIIAFGGATTTGTLQYTGAGDSSDRNVRIGTTTVGNTGGGVLNSSGSGALTFTAPTFNTAVATVTAARNLTLGGTYTGGINEIQGAIVDNDTGTGGAVSITKSDAGTWALSGDNTYTGTTTVSAGTLLINGNSSTATGAVAVNGGTLGGIGRTGGAVTVAALATLSPGASIESLDVDSLSMASTSIFSYEVADNTATGADLLASRTTLSLTGVTLSLDPASLAALAGAGWTAGNKLTLISYLGAGITSGFTGYADDTNYTFGSNVWLFDYNDTVAGGNYGTDAIAGGQDRFVTLTAVTVIPEPRAALLGGLGMLMLLRRRRR